MNDRRVISMLCALVLAAAGPALCADLAKTLQGKWQADMIATLKGSANFKQMSAEGQKAMLEKMKGAPAFIFEFTDKTITTRSGDEAPDTASYTVLKSEGKKLALQVVVKKGDTEIKEDTDVEVVDADSIKLSQKGGDLVLVLHRVK